MKTNVLDSIDLEQERIKDVCLHVFLFVYVWRLQIQDGAVSGIARGPREHPQCTICPIQGLCSCGTNRAAGGTAGQRVKMRECPAECGTSGSYVLPMSRKVDKLSR